MKDLESITPPRKWSSENTKQMEKSHVLRGRKKQNPIKPPKKILKMDAPPKTNTEPSKKKMEIRIFSLRSHPYKSKPSIIKTMGKWWTFLPWGASIIAFLQCSYVIQPLITFLFDILIRCFFLYNFLLINSKNVRFCEKIQLSLFRSF